MPEPSRADRRRATRGGASAPPPRRDPMVPIYIGVGVLIVAVILIFAGYRYQQTRVVADANATPTPAAAPTPKPVQLQDGPNGTIGLKHYKPGNAPAGGKGQTVDGIECAAGMTEYAGLHIHPHLAIIANGKQYAVPQLIGFAANPSLPNGGCLYWIHTHDASGIIHIESPEITPPSGGTHYTLGMFFDIWGEPLAPDQVADFKGPVTAYVNGVKYDGNLRDIPLLSHQQIVLEVGTPVPPPAYLFPPND